MKILIAEDDLISQRLLETTLLKWNHEVVVTNDGEEALKVLQSEDVLQLAIFDWMMPGLSGVDLCREARQTPELSSLYIILLTTRTSTDDMVTGLEAGADDFIAKPCDPQELHARIRVGQRVLGLQESLRHRVRELEEALGQVRRLQEILPICSYCQQIRDDQNYWQDVENYISLHTDTKFSHGVCPDCYEREVMPQLQELGF